MSTTLDMDDQKLKDINDTLTEIINLKCLLIMVQIKFHLTQYQRV